METIISEYLWYAETFRRWLTELCCGRRHRLERHCGIELPRPDDHVFLGGLDCKYGTDADHIVEALW